MNVRSFLDTNLFIYQLEALDERKFSIANRIIREGVATGNACISFQVIQECLNTVLRKAEIVLDTKGARETTSRPCWHRYFRFRRASPFTGAPSSSGKRYRFSFYDSLIVAAALEGGCTRLYSEDLQHGQRVERLVIENPFRT